MIYIHGGGQYIERGYHEERVMHYYPFFPEKKNKYIIKHLI